MLFLNTVGKQPYYFGWPSSNSLAWLTLKILVTPNSQSYGCNDHSKISCFLYWFLMFSLSTLWTLEVIRHMHFLISQSHSIYHNQCSAVTLFWAFESPRIPNSFSCILCEANSSISHAWLKPQMLWTPLKTFNTKGGRGDMDGYGVVSIWGLKSTRIFSLDSYQLFCCPNNDSKPNILSYRPCLNSKVFQHMGVNFKFYCYVEIWNSIDSLYDDFFNDWVSRVVG